MAIIGRHSGYNSTYHLHLQALMIIMKMNGHGNLACTPGLQQRRS